MNGSKSLFIIYSSVKRDNIFATCSFSHEGWSIVWFGLATEGGCDYLMHLSSTCLRNVYRIVATRFVLVGLQSIELPRSDDEQRHL